MTSHVPLTEAVTQNIVIGMMNIVAKTTIGATTTIGAARAHGHTSKVRHLKTALDELKPKTDMGAKRIQNMLHSHRDRFLRQQKETMERGWTDWAKHVAELHTFRADQENRVKEGKGIYKLNEEGIA